MFGSDTPRHSRKNWELFIFIAQVRGFSIARINAVFCLGFYLRRVIDCANVRVDTLTACHEGTETDKIYLIN